MRGLALCAALALLVGLGSADLQVKTIQEQSEAGQTSGTYALVQDGKVVGMVQRYSSSAGPLRLQMGRRAGPSDDDLPPHAARIMDLIHARMAFVSLLQGQLQATRCPFARQMALLRMQAAAAAGQAEPAVGDESEFRPFTGPFPRHARMFGEPEPMDASEVHPPGVPAQLPVQRGPHAVYMPRDHANGGTGPFRTAADFDAWKQANPAWPRPELPREGGFDGQPVEHQTAHPNFPRPLLWRGEQALPPFDHSNPQPQAWTSLERAAVMPAHDVKPEVDWSLFEADGSLNWGLLTFMALTLACAAVWGAMLVQCCAYCRAHRAHSERAAFITAIEADPKLRPLLHEGALYASEEPSLKAKEGLEYAAAHVPASAANVTVLQYQPLKPSF